MCRVAVEFRNVLAKEYKQGMGLIAKQRTMVFVIFPKD